MVFNDSFYVFQMWNVGKLRKSKCLVERLVYQKCSKECWEEGAGEVNQPISISHTVSLQMKRPVWLGAVYAASMLKST